MTSLISLVIAVNLFSGFHSFTFISKFYRFGLSRLADSSASVLKDKRRLSSTIHNGKSYPSHTEHCLRECIREKKWEEAEIIVNSLNSSLLSGCRNVVFVITEVFISRSSCCWMYTVNAI